MRCVLIFPCSFITWTKCSIPRSWIRCSPLRWTVINTSFRITPSRTTNWIRLSRSSECGWISLGLKNCLDHYPNSPVQSKSLWFWTSRIFPPIRLFWMSWAKAISYACHPTSLARRILPRRSNCRICWSRKMLNMINVYSKRKRTQRKRFQLFGVRRINFFSKLPLLKRIRRSFLQNSRLRML